MYDSLSSLLINLSGKDGWTLASFYFEVFAWMLSSINTQ